MKIIKPRQQDANADTKELEGKIDKLARRLYDLTEKKGDLISRLLPFTSAADYNFSVSPETQINERRDRQKRINIKSTDRFVKNYGKLRTDRDD